MSSPETQPQKTGEGTLKKFEKTKTHTRYFQQDGTQVKGATTHLNNLGWSKEGLIYWAWDLGCKGLDYKKVRDQAADVGTITHFIIQCHIESKCQGILIQPDTSQFSEADLDTAESGYRAFIDWERQAGVQWLESEKILVSEKLPYGGTIDAVAVIDGKLDMIDFKTGKGIYSEAYGQAAAYFKVGHEHGYIFDGCTILHIDKKNATFTPHPVTPRLIDLGWRLFQDCVDLTLIKQEFK